MTKDEQIEAAWKSHEQWRETRGLLCKAGQAMKIRLAEAQNWRCCYCGCRMDKTERRREPTFEHVIPRALGGSDDESNLVIACCACNQDRGATMQDQHVLAARINGLEIVW